MAQINSTPWDGWPPEPQRDGWYWVQSVGVQRVAFWSAGSRGWKRIGRTARLTPDMAARAAWVLLCEVSPPTG